jgi:hypothetical protein
LVRKTGAELGPFEGNTVWTLSPNQAAALYRRSRRDPIGQGELRAMEEAEAAMLGELNASLRLLQADIEGATP